MSTNPYAQAADGAAAPGASPEQKQMADYELAVGTNTDYFLPKFEEFDNGGSQARLALAGVLRDVARGSCTARFRGSAS